MITLKKAFEIAQAHGTYGYPLSRIADETDDFWIFYLDTDEVLIGPTPIAVEKKNGRVWGFSPIHMAPEQYDEIVNNARQVEVTYK